MSDDSREARPRRWRLAVVLGVVVVAVAVGGSWVYRQFTHVNVIDARVAADMIVLSSRVPGWVTGVEVIEGDVAARGRVLVTIDDRRNRLRLDELDARIEALEDSREETRARLAMVDRQTRSAIEARQAAIDVARAALSSAEAERDLARLDNRRIAKLADQGAINRSRLDKTRTVLATAREAVGSAEAQLHNAKAELTEARADRGQLGVLHKQLAGLEAQAKQLRAQREQARLDLHDRTLSMPFDGVIDRVFIDDGEYVTAGQRLVMVHDPRAVRVEANVKETDFRHFTPGKSVDVHVDALPDRHFEGTVERVGQAATSEFALLPSPNPSGNFTKITQRLPVRIAVEQTDGLLKPGMMVELETTSGG
ncbi:MULTISPECIES: HlyD family secretion protein [unclassified Modicisalibacter]|uniref:HlyD family secretion protein n=1 Tax=unclassified Modicisalibacter TaxID=2679913 RepID=UPI001CCD20EA|nr:HlyD family secretion protein [Modicisalibacter sp. R2A 31.J]MBZ9575524.1 HlyD family secretion protein [Modicisalibacter sp. MOD 31.J]